jgi:hypothetical protein
VPQPNQRHFNRAVAISALVLAFAAGRVSSARGAEVVETKSMPFALGAEIGTAGYGPKATFAFSKYFTVTGGYTWLNYDYDSSSADSDYRSRLKLSNMQAFVNWYPFADTFYFSAGAFFSRNKVFVAAKPKSGATFDVGGKTYTADQVGTLSGEADLGKKAEPYVGFGWAKRLLNGGIGFFADFGVLFTSAANARLSATGPIANDPGFQANLRTEERDIDHHLKPLRYYPVVQLGLLYRF